MPNDAFEGGVGVAQRRPVSVTLVGRHFINTTKEMRNV
jgi:hypothetical protein